ncbi:Inosine-5'-monophosphate dehydrogenase [Vibrio stylophorae]|uniref:Inosine-5'-monophosphate dehydrogenase n=1 Tax=Vibrio stylophorae TaxID=659351 RepID=A0ABN8DS84_9VIBR|nr:CBS domain-containing protein [Vibrio stylophorae]CAH0533059.1 Inosine-5'-monophosphate dehydrogenase [Vibrio stylophorae]
MDRAVVDYMSHPLITIHQNDGLREAFILMSDAKIRHLPVLNDHGELVGIISERQLRQPLWLSDSEQRCTVTPLDEKVQVRQIMSQPVITVQQTDTLRQAIHHFLHHHISAAPVVDNQGALVGMLSQVDLLRAFDQHLEEN